MKKQISFILLITLLLQVCGFTGFAYAAPDPDPDPAYSAVTCSAGSSTVAAGSVEGVIVDEGITLSSGVNLTGAKVYITTGFNSTTDELMFTNTTSITGIYTSATGILALTGNSTPEDYQAALRSVKIKTSLTGTGSKTVVFALGTNLEYGGNYYEYVNNGSNITWTAAKTAAEGRTFYGQTGYLATIASAEENDFLTQKLGADAWIGASDATTEGAWSWVTGPIAEQVQFSSGNYPGMTSVLDRYNNWNAIEPNNSAPSENYAEIYCSKDNPGKWNDLSYNGNVTGYLVEYSGVTGASSTKTINVTPARMLSYDGNENTGGNVPSNTSYVDSTTATVSGNTGNLAKTGKSFAGWNTTSSGIGTTYYPGDSFTITANTTLYAIWADESTVDCSVGLSSVTVGNANGTIVDSGLTIGSGALISGAKANITMGFDSANDALSFTATTNISGSYDAAKGTLTLTGNAAPGEYQTALRSITLKTSSSAVGTRTIVFSLGNKLANGGHNYEYVNNGGNITWTAAKSAAEARTYYGQSGYLATISSQTENDFLAQKLAADAWFGASDVTTEGAWYWIAGPAEERIQFSSGVYPATTFAGVYSNWATNQPDNYNSTEHYGEIYCTGENPGKWNDLPNNASITGYLVEYNEVTGASDSKEVSIVAQTSDRSRRSSTPSSGVNVIINGQIQSAGKQTETIENGVKTSEVDVDETIVSAIIDSVLAAQQTGSNQENVIELKVSADADNIKVALTGDVIKRMDDHDFTLNISYENVSYLIPAKEIKISELATQLGAEILTDIEIKIEFHVPDAATLAKMAELAKARDYEIMIPPMNFEVIGVNINTNQQITISKYSNYVERIFEIPANVDPNKITTGIVYNADGTFSHIPTRIVKIGEKYYAKLSSLTNSTYSVVCNTITVSSVENRWSKIAVNDMASRLVISNPESFNPDKNITRGEFAEYITKALGIYRTEIAIDGLFIDVTKENPLGDAIKTAVEYGIIKGYTDGSFKPNATITREEAMVMFYRAMEITGLEGTEKDRNLSFADFNAVGKWASSSVKEVLAAKVFNGLTTNQIAPKSNFTHAEALTAVRNLLLQSGLINE